MKQRKERVPPWATRPAQSSVELWKSFLFEGDNLYLAKVQVSDLGFNRKTRYREICERAKVLKLDLCPRAAHFELTKHCGMLPDGEVLHLAMEPYVGSDRLTSIITLHQYHNFIARGSVACRDETLFRPADLFVFKMP